MTNLKQNLFETIDHETVTNKQPSIESRKENLILNYVSDLLHQFNIFLELQDAVSEEMFSNEFNSFINRILKIHIQNYDKQYLKRIIENAFDVLNDDFDKYRFANEVIALAYELHDTMYINEQIQKLVRLCVCMEREYDINFYKHV